MRKKENKSNIGTAILAGLGGLTIGVLGAMFIGKKKDVPPPSTVETKSESSSIGNIIVGAIVSVIATVIGAYIIWWLGIK